jgi:phospholipid transport system substrate-binding protein
MKFHTRCQGEWINAFNNPNEPNDPNDQNELNEPNEYNDSRREDDMNRRISGLAMMLAAFLIMPLQSYASTPKETVETGVNNVIATLSDPAFKAKAKDEQIAQIGDVIDTIFDFNELSKRTLGREWRKMKPAQQKEFTQLFRELLQGVYADRLLAYSDQKIIFEKELMLKKGRAEVQSYLQTSDGKKIPLFYRLTDKSGSWKVYDLIIEGVSMVKNYRTQFREILAKDSPDKLLQILRDKVSKT